MGSGGRTLAAAHSALVMVDLQVRLMQAIAGGGAVIAEARRLRGAAALCGVPVLFTEQNPVRLGPTVPELAPAEPVLSKMCFDAGRDPAFVGLLPARGTVNWTPFLGPGLRCTPFQGVSFAFAMTRAVATWARAVLPST